MSVRVAHVEPAPWSSLERAFGTLVQRAPAKVESYRTQSLAEPTRWQLVTIWQSHQAFEEYRAAAPTPEVVLFEKVGAEPRRSRFEVARLAVAGGPGWGTGASCGAPREPTCAP